jgi:hypothetical protein
MKKTLAVLSLIAWLTSAPATSYATSSYNNIDLVSNLSNWIPDASSLWSTIIEKIWLGDSTNIKNLYSNYLHYKTKFWWPVATPDSTTQIYYNPSIRYVSKLSLPEVDKDFDASVQFIDNLISIQIQSPYTNGAVNMTAKYDYQTWIVSDYKYSHGDESFWYISEQGWSKFLSAFLSNYTLFSVTDKQRLFVIPAYTVTNTLPPEDEEPFEVPILSL